jgi:tetratricopeptide (TPR) repeat protein
MIPLVAAYATQVNSPNAERKLLYLKRRGLIELREVESQTLGQGPFIYLHPLMRRYASELLERSGEIKEAHAAAGRWFRNRISTWDPKAEQFPPGLLGAVNDDETGLLAAYHLRNAGIGHEAQQVLVAVADLATRQGREKRLFRALDELRRDGPLEPWLQVYWGDLVLNGWTEGEPAEGETMLRGLAESVDLKVASAALICLARAEFRAKRMNAAVELLLKSRGLKEGIQPPDRKGIAFIWNELGHIALYDGRSYRDALSDHEHALEIQGEIGDGKGMAYTLRRMASIYLYNFNDPVKALDLLGESRVHACNAGSKLVLILILNEEAEALSRLERFAEAVAKLQEALKLARECDDPHPEAHALKRLALLYERVELYGDARLVAERARTIFASLRPEEARDMDHLVRRLREKCQDLEAERDRADALVRQLERDGVRSGPDLRIARRLVKRLRQKLGQEPAMIRLGKKPPA